MLSVFTASDRNSHDYQVRANASEYQDHDLIQRIACYDESALTMLYERYHRLVYAIALRITNDVGVAEEVLQDTFFSVWKSAASFKTDGSLVAWLIGTARHRAFDATRSRTFRARARENMLDDLRSGWQDEPVERAIDQQAQREILHLAMSALNPAQREAIRLAYYEELTQREIANQLGAPLGTVKARIRLGLDRLKGLLQTA